MHINDVESIGHIARLAVLSALARAALGAEAELAPEVSKMVITVERTTDGNPYPVSAEFYGAHAIPVGGMSL